MSRPVHGRCAVGRKCRDAGVIFRWVGGRFSLCEQPAGVSRDACPRCRAAGGHPPGSLPERACKAAWASNDGTCVLHVDDLDGQPNGRLAVVGGTVDERCTFSAALEIAGQAGLALEVEIDGRRMPAFLVRGYLRARAVPGEG